MLFPLPPSWNDDDNTVLIAAGCFFVGDLRSGTGVTGALLAVSCILLFDNVLSVLR